MHGTYATSTIALTSPAISKFRSLCNHKQCSVMTAVTDEQAFRFLDSILQDVTGIFGLSAM